MDRREAVRTYYEAIDAGAYDRLAEALDPSFVHRRSDRTLDGRDAFVGFMRDERPRTDTVHRLETVCVCDESTAFVRGRLDATDGEELFGFVDVFDLGDDGRLRSLTTYTR
jgi:ketosteroid isomerase-like protein